MITENIIASRTVNTGKGKRIIVTTATGAEVWVKEEQYNPSATQITYKANKAGDTVVAIADGTSKDGKQYKKGDSIVLLNDNNQLVGMGQQGFESKMIILQKMGIQPTFAL